MTLTKEKPNYMNEFSSSKSIQQVPRIFRVFVSSSFTDLKEERNRLQEFVFPRLQELCTSHGCLFQAIDLRWGISNEAGLDQKTMQICFDELRRCQNTSPRPNFIVLLGDRYGWQPLPEKIPSDEFDCISRNIRSEKGSKLFNKWYKEDTNARVKNKSQQSISTYILQPRTGEYINYGFYNKNVQIPLTTLLQKIVAQIDSEIINKGRYLYSATHQEIIRGAMQQKKDTNHIFGFYREISNLGELTQTLPEMTAAPFVDTDIDNCFDFVAYDKLQKLKSELAVHLGIENIFNYQEKWQDKSLTTDFLGKLPVTLKECQLNFPSDHQPTNLCEAVWCKLRQVIENEIAAIDHKSALQVEIESHTALRVARSKGFVGQSQSLLKINSYLNSRAKEPIVLYGSSGMGKTTLLAKVVDDYGQEFQSYTDKKNIILERYIGVTPYSFEIKSLLVGICSQIQQEYGQQIVQPPDDIQQLSLMFKQLLALATIKKPMLIVLDALDQLHSADDAHLLAWLPIEIPEHVKIIISTTSDDAAVLLTTLRNRLKQSLFIELKGFSAIDADQTLSLWLDNIGRKITDKQRLEILNGFERSRLPLYLKLAFEEARHWHSYDSHSHSLGETVSEIVENFLSRLSRPDNHGCFFVARSLGYLCAAKNGLSEDEMIKILSSDKALFQQLKKEYPHHAIIGVQIPIVVWSRLYHDLSPYLTERAVNGTFLMTFYHRQIGKIVENKYCKGKEKLERHLQLGDYFSHTDLIFKVQNGALSGDLLQIRKATEQVWQWIHAQEWERAFENLTNFQFLEYMVMHNSFATLFEEMSTVAANCLNGEMIKKMSEVIANHQFGIDRKPWILFSELIAKFELSENQSYQDILEREKKRVQSLRFWMQFKANHFLHQLGGAEKQEQFAEKYPLPNIKALAVDCEMLHLYTVSSRKIEVYSMRSGVVLRQMALEMDIRYAAAAVSPSGSYFAITTDKGDLVVYRCSDLSSAARVKTKGGEDLSFVFSDDNNIIHLNQAGELELFRIAEQRQQTLGIFCLDGITCCAGSSSGDFMVVGPYQPIGRIMIISSKANPVKICELSAHNGIITGLACSRDGNFFISCSEDRQVIVWNNEGKQKASLNCNELIINNFLLTPVALEIDPEGKVCQILLECGTLITWEWQHQSEKQCKVYQTGLGEDGMPVGDLAILVYVTENILLCANRVVAEALKITVINSNNDLSFQPLFRSLYPINRSNGSSLATVDKAGQLYWIKNNQQLDDYISVDTGYAKHWFSQSSSADQPVWFVADKTRLGHMETDTGTAHIDKEFRIPILASCPYKEGVLISFGDGYIDWYHPYRGIKNMFKEQELQAQELQIVNDSVVVVVWQKIWDGSFYMQIVVPHNNRKGPLLPLGHHCEVLAVTQKCCVVADGSRLIVYDFELTGLKCNKRDARNTVFYSTIEFYSDSLLLAGGRGGFLDLYKLETLELLTSVWVDELYDCVIAEQEVIFTQKQGRINVVTLNYPEKTSHNLVGKYE